MGSTMKEKLVLLFVLWLFAAIMPGSTVPFLLS